MAKLDPLWIMMFIIRMIPAILFVILMMVIFFSFRVDVRDEGMKRFVIEMSDSLTSSPNLTDYKSIFNPQKLTDTENKDPNRNIELYSTNCDYGYYLDIESLAGPTECSSGSDCINFCYSACGLDSSTIDMSTVGTINGNCGCNIELIGNNFCQCKKTGGDWQDGYKWGYGYVPGYKRMASLSDEFPVGITSGETALPAKMTITATDSFLTKISCMAKKAFTLKEKISIKYDTTYVTINSVFKRSGTAGTHVCLYYQGYYSSQSEPYECRYFPDIPFLDFQFTPTSSTGTITAYPITNSFATCNDIKANTDLIAGYDDTPATVLFCLGGTP